MSMTVGEIPALVEGKLVQTGDPQRVISHLLLDSRQLRSAGETLFFAIRGLRQDGHQFIPELYASGVRAFVVSHFDTSLQVPEASVVVVDDVIHALQSLVAHHRSGFQLPVIAITGSNGKTIIKEWLFHLLHEDLRMVRSPRSYNSQIGVPLSVWQLNPNVDLGIFEAGISRPGEMDALREVIQPTLGLFTNIGTAHDSGFASRHEKIEEKALLFTGADRVVCCADHGDIMSVLHQRDLKLFTWTLQDRQADLLIHEEAVAQSGTILHYKYGVQQGSIRIPFTDAASVQNACHCLAMLCMLGQDLSALKARFATLPVIEMRLEVRAGMRDCILINDAYSADLESLAVALSFARQQSMQGSRTIILTDMLQQGLPTEQLYHQVADWLVEYGFSRLIGIGRQVMHLQQWLPDAVSQHYYATSNQLLESLPELSFEHELVLIKGARSFGLERIANQLSLRQHVTILEINLAALARNLKVFESYLQPGVKIMAMVKAAAYGSGGVEVARFLASRNVDYLAVAYVDEGIQLRKAGIQCPVMVLNSIPEQTPLMLAHDLEPEVYTLEQLRETIRYCDRARARLRIHLKLETGMHRLGFDEAELSALISVLSATVLLEVVSVFSHLAASEARSEDLFTQAQIRQFVRMADRITNELHITPLRHILNSNGVVRHPEAQFDMVRLGIGMYGIGMPAEVPLEVVHELRSYISQIKHVPAGSTIGYGRMERTDTDKDIATVAIGYADGLIRKAGNRRYALVVNGRPAPIVGNVCMDMTMIDVTGREDVMVGTPVTIFGTFPSISRLAEAGETIPYEVFTNLSERIKRVYIYE